jgi:diacylglycerol kinase (ATP)
MNTCIIYNPHAGHVDETLLRETFATWPHTELWPTRGIGDGCQLARKAVRDGAKTVVAVGGDGTIGEIVNGLIGYLDRVRLAILPLGTGNDFARSLQIPTDWEAAVEVLRQGATRRFDMVQVRRHEKVIRHFVNLAVGGFTEEGKIRIEQTFKENWGPFGYLRAALESTWEISPYRIELTLDDDPPEIWDASILVVANSGFMSAGIPIVPVALADDGKLNILAICPTTVAELLVLAPWVLAGNHLESEWVIHRTARKAVVRTNPVMPFHVDDLFVTYPTLEFEVIPQALAIVIPEGATLEEETNVAGEQIQF